MSCHIGVCTPVNDESTTGTTSFEYGTSTEHQFLFQSFTTRSSGRLVQIRIANGYRYDIVTINRVGASGNPLTDVLTETRFVDSQGPRTPAERVKSWGSFELVTPLAVTADAHFAFSISVNGNSFTSISDADAYSGGMMYGQATANDPILPVSPSRDISFLTVVTN